MTSDTECESEQELIAVSSRRGGQSERRQRWKEWLWTGSTSVSLERTDIPRDKCHVVYVCMLVSGAGFLFPWSSYVTAIDYFFFLYWKDFHQVCHLHLCLCELVSTSFSSTGVSDYSHDLSCLYMAIYWAQYISCQCHWSAHPHWFGLHPFPRFSDSHSSDSIYILLCM